MVPLLQCGPQDGEGPKPPPAADPRKPNWWPDPPPSGGFPWPPPRPDNYEGDEWPPLREVGENPQVWVDLYGERPDPTQDPRFAEPGHTARNGFYRNFKEINETDQKPPGCGLHLIRLFKGQFVETCDPFPQAVARQICPAVLDPDAADERCRVVCQNNPQKCRNDRVFTPPLEVSWNCVRGCTEAPPTPCPDYVNCAAYYLCDCFEN
jgi:hypothetical protein